MADRDAHGRFVSPKRPGDETFVEITNEDIYREVKGIGVRVDRVEARVTGLETRIAGFHRRVALAVPTATTLAALATTYYYLRGGH